MPQTDHKEKPTKIPAIDDAESEFQIPAGGENLGVESSLKSDPKDSGAPDPETGEASEKDLPLSDDDDPKPEVKINLTPENFKLVITDTSEETTEIIANTDYHAFFIKDKIASSCLDKFNEATEDLWLGETARSDSVTPSQNSSRIFLPLVERLRNKSPNTKVIFTVKKKTATEQSVRTRQYINILCDRLNLSSRDKEMIACAGHIHAMAKIGHPHRPHSNFRLSPETKARLSGCFDENSVIIKILRSMYCSLKSEEARRPSLELMGANILTIVDLFCDTVHDEEYLDAETLGIISRELTNLAGKLILKEVVEAFSPIPGTESQNTGSAEKPIRIIIYSDRPTQIYPLKVRLKNGGMRAMAADSLESLATICKRGLPDVLILRINSNPNVVVKAMQFLSGKGIDIGAIPTFLLVKSSIISRLASLIKIGIEDIIDINTDLDVLILKIRKAQTNSELTSKAPHSAAAQQSGSRGNLCEMNLIDLLQALGPSRRTTRITVKKANASSESLTIYLAQGSIIFAELGDLKGETAIHKALGWADGTWAIEQITPDDLPEPNNDLPNEAILMEGCRLLDESSR